MAKTLVELWSATVRRDPDAVAIVEAATGRRATRAGLAARAAEVRGALPSGLRGRRVVLAAPNDVEWLAMFLALLESGAIPAAVDASEPPAARLAIARAIGAARLWNGEELRPVADAPRRNRRPDLALLKLTSGSTGAPRALPFTHAQMIADGRQVCATMRIGPGDVNLAAIPFGHSYGLGSLVVPLLVQGTAIVCASGPLPRELAADCARWRPTVFPAVPPILRALVLADIAPADLASLRTVISAGAALPPETARAFEEKFGHPVHGFYGSSETGGICYDRTGEATREGRSVGPPLGGVRLRFARGGRFTVESPAVMRAGRHRPGDLGRLDARGELVLLGRAGRMVKIAGRRLDLGEVEALLRTVPGVREAHAIAHPTRGDAVAAAICGASTSEARAHLARTAAAWKIPHRLIAVDPWPVTARGKSDTRALRARLGEAENAGSLPGGRRQRSTP